MFHPHIHCLVPGAGLDAAGKLVRVKQADFLVYLPRLQAAFRQHMRGQLEGRGWEVDPQVWRLDWGVDIRAVGSGASAVKYLGAYVARTAIGDSRMVEVTEQSVTFRWRDRSDGNRLNLMTLPGPEFVDRFLRHPPLAGKCTAFRAAVDSLLRVQSPSGQGQSVPDPVADGHAGGSGGGEIEQGAGTVAVLPVLPGAAAVDPGF